MTEWSVSRPPGEPRDPVRRGRRRLVAALAAITVLVAGAVMIIPGVPTPTPAASTAVTDPGAAYVACTNVVNDGGRPLNVGLDWLGSPIAANLGTQEAIYVEFAGLEASFRLCLDNISWSQSLQPDVRAVLAASMTAEDLCRSAATARTPADLAALADPMRAEQVTYVAAVLRLRSDLGLPPPLPSPDPSAPPAWF
jgi:hypothetical protein